MFDALSWIYLVNSVLIIVHEIDSAYWKEWNLFRIPGGITSFLIIHIPLVFLILYGLVLVFQHSLAGLIFSLILSLAGIFAFSVHISFIKRGRDEFKAPISLAILATTLITSIVQIVITIYLLIK